MASHAKLEEALDSYRQAVLARVDTVIERNRRSVFVPPPVIDPPIVDDPKPGDTAETEPQGSDDPVTPEPQPAVSPPGVQSSAAPTPVTSDSSAPSGAPRREQRPPRPEPAPQPIVEEQTPVPRSGWPARWKNVVRRLWTGLLRLLRRTRAG